MTHIYNIRRGQRVSTNGGKKFREVLDFNVVGKGVAVKFADQRGWSTFAWERRVTVKH